jgi:glycosyltransferase involved in cell wall biosynthesis
MSVYSTEENKKDLLLERTLQSLFQTVNFDKHRLIVSINGMTDDTKLILKRYAHIISEIIYNTKNIGTAEAINCCWKLRDMRENAIKMDDDVEIHSAGWVDEMEEAILRDATIGQVGLKRKDLIECPTNADAFYKSELLMLPQNPGERWMIVERCNHIMGTCVMHSAALLNTVGYLFQMKGNKYGFDDSLMSLRSRLAGFKNVFLPHIEIDHIDPGATPFQKWKEQNAGSYWAEYHKTVADYQSGKLPLYYNPFI